MYEGEFYNNYWQGKGILYDEEGNKIYEGEFYNNKMLNKFNFDLFKMYMTKILYK